MQLKHTLAGQNQQSDKILQNKIDNKSLFSILIFKYHSPYDTTLNHQSSSLPAFFT